MGVSPQSVYKNTPDGFFLFRLSNNEPNNMKLLSVMTNMGFSHILGVSKNLFLMPVLSGLCVCVTQRFVRFKNFQTIDNLHTRWQKRKQNHFSCQIIVVGIRTINRQKQVNG